MRALVQTPRRFAVAAAATAFAVVALSVGVGSGGGTPQRPTYYQDVKPILDGRCIGCHTAGGIGPFPLRTYAQARARRFAIAEAVTRRIMPPWHAERGVRRYAHDPSLTNAQIALIRRWVARGAPKGDPARPGRPLAPVGGRLSRVDVHLPLPTYTPVRRANGDEYRCFVVPWGDRAAYVTGSDVIPGERRQVHHIIVYLASAANAATVDAWDARDDRAGYGCYGGPSATGARQIPAQFLAGWAPGGAGGDLPAGTGIRVPPGSRLIVQIHYNVEHGAPRPDRSTVELKLDDAVARRGVYLPIVNVAWLIAPQSFTIPAGRKRVVHQFTGDPRGLLRFLGGEADLTRGFDIHSVLHHMHRLGKRGRITVERASGRREVLLAIARWDFHWQRDYRLAEPVRFLPGDRLSIRCEHDNSRANQPLVAGRRGKPRTVTWGEDSSDEMCIGFLYVSEP